MQSEALHDIVGHDLSCFVLGADVTHPSSLNGESKLNPSIASLVGNIDDDIAMFPLVTVKAQTPFKETIVDFKQMFAALLDARKRRQSRLPNRIVYIRDGVAEGQFETVLREEADKIDEVYRDWREAPPKVTVIIVQKRHNVRFFPDSLDGNIPAGVVIRNDLMSPGEFPNFWLNSHHGCIGTSHPCRYFLVRNDLQFGMERISEFCFGLCHMLGRCTRVVSYPSPTFYAHLAAYRGKILAYDVSSNSSRNSLTEEVVRECNEAIRNRLPGLTNESSMFYV